MLSAILRTARFFKTPGMATKWAAEFIDDRVTTPRHKQHLDYYTQRQMPVAEGTARALGIDIEPINAQLATLPEFLVSENKDPGMTFKWSATAELAATTYVLVKMLKPNIMVETGVGAGVSSWTILQAMEENDNGRLISIDLPTPNTELLPEVGYLVPKKLRHRWDLRTGPSRRLLPQALSELGGIDIFQHDSRHSYSNQLREYQTAWPSIKSGGMLISDDVSNDALYDASRTWEREPTIIGQSKESPIGLVRKA
jgi:predicted O-methyltransferase YrrM